MVESARPHTMTICRMWITKATNAHSEYVILMVRQRQRLCTWVLMLLSVNCLIFFFGGGYRFRIPLEVPVFATKYEGESNENFKSEIKIKKHSSIAL